MALSEFGNLDRGALTVQASQTHCELLAAPALVAFHRQHPGVDIRLSVGNTAQVAEAVETGAAELGFVEGVVEKDKLSSARVALDQMILVVGPDHPWATGPSPAVGDLIESEWVLRERGSGTRSVFEQALERAGVALKQLRIAMELPSNEAVRAAVEAGLGATALSASVVASSIENGLLHHVPFKLPPREFHVLQHRQRYRSRISDAFLKTIDAPATQKAGTDVRERVRG